MMPFLNGTPPASASETFTPTLGLVNRPPTLDPVAVTRERERGIEPGRIVLAGFSQGGAIALHTGLRHPERLAGILALSTYLPLAGTLEAERSAASAEVPVFMAHGLHDEMIGIERALSSRDALEALGYAPAWHAYPMAHAVCEEEVTAIAGWLVRML